jgi:hypothetical protein
MRRMFVPRLAACSVAWNTETLELESADGRTQVVDILWRDALEAVQQHFLTTRYDMGELQFEPRIADRLADQVFDDYCNSFLYYLECSYLPEGQYPLLYELSSASVHDVWKLEDDVRKRGRYFVNQFVGAYRPTEDAADEDAEDDAVDEAV